MLIPLDDIDRYALDIEKIATGAGSVSERGSAVDMVDRRLDDRSRPRRGHVRLHGAPTSRTEYLMAFRKKLDRLRAVSRRQRPPGHRLSGGPPDIKPAV